MPAKPIEDLTGKTYGRWTVLGGRRKQSTQPKAAHQTRCQCACGTRRWVLVTGLRSGRTRSCGCWAKEKHTQVIQSRGFMPKSFTEAP